MEQLKYLERSITLSFQQQSLIALDLLSDETKATVFISLGLKDIKDMWLERHAQVAFNDGN